jgi:hypothetical protein
MNNKLIPYTNNLIKKYDLSIKNNVDKCLCSYIEAIIFNIITIASIITFINNCKSINKETLYILKEYIYIACSPTSMKGGGGATVMPSEFYGINSNNYSPTNNQMDLLTIDFNSTSIRPQIGGGRNDNKPVVDIIKKFLKYFNLKASSAIMKEILDIINNYIDCLMTKLKKINGNKLTPMMIKKVIKSNKIFNIFK